MAKLKLSAVPNDRPVKLTVELPATDRTGEHPERHLQGYGGILQADAYAGFNRLYDGARKPGPLLEVACWSRSGRKFFVLADVTARARANDPFTKIGKVQVAVDISSVIRASNDNRLTACGIVDRRPLRNPRARLTASDEDSPVPVVTPHAG